MVRANRSCASCSHARDRRRDRSSRIARRAAFARLRASLRRLPRRLGLPLLGGADADDARASRRHPAPLIELLEGLRRASTASRRRTASRARPANASRDARSVGARSRRLGAPRLRVRALRPASSSAGRRSRSCCASAPGSSRRCSTAGCGASRWRSATRSCADGRTRRSATMCSSSRPRRSSAGVGGAAMFPDHVQRLVALRRRGARASSSASRRRTRSRSARRVLPRSTALRTQNRRCGSGRQASATRCTASAPAADRATAARRCCVDVTRVASTHARRHPRDAADRSRLGADLSARSRGWSSSAAGCCRTARSSRASSASRRVVGVEGRDAADSARRD